MRKQLFSDKSAEIDAYLLALERDAAMCVTAKCTMEFRYSFFMNTFILVEIGVDPVSRGEYENVKR